MRRSPEGPGGGAGKEKGADLIHFRRKKKARTLDHLPEKAIPLYDPDRRLAQRSGDLFTQGQEGGGGKGIASTSPRGLGKKERSNLAVSARRRRQGHRAHSENTRELTV